MQNIKNNTEYTLRKIHRYDILNEQINERCFIDVIEPPNNDKSQFLAMPFRAGFNCDNSVIGKGDSAEEALNDCLDKISKMSWEEFIERSEAIAPDLME